MSHSRRSSMGSASAAMLAVIAGVPLTLGLLALNREPTPEELIKNLEKGKAPATPSAPPAPAPTQPTQPNTPAPVTDTTTMAEAATTGTRLLREGTYLTSRRGRMSRSTGNEWVYSFDADAKGKADPAMILMPCMNLQNMERVVERTGEGVNFTISGQVFVYKGRNYLLPTMYVVNRRSDIAPAQ